MSTISVPKDQTFLIIANSLGLLSTCDRAGIGAVVTREGRCVAWGYNGAPPGLPHCDENDHGWKGMLPGPDRAGCRNATHAEANAIAAAAKQGISTDGGTLYVSQSPCLDCSRLIIAAGIVRVVYDRMYRDRSGLELLATAEVDLLCMNLR